jgi:hypothetical protein
MTIVVTFLDRSTLTVRHETPTLGIVLDWPAILASR